VTTDDQAPPLSARQIEVLRSVAKGLSNQEIAQELSISVNTVRVHLRNIFEKSGVQSRTEATMWAIQQGYVKPETGSPQLETLEPATTRDHAPLLVARLSRWQRFFFVFAVVVAIFIFAVPMIKPAFNPLQPQIAPPDFDNARWFVASEMPTARSGLTLAAYNKELYVIGGERTSGATGLVEAFNLETATWREAAGKPTPVTDVQGVTIDDRIYLAGGCDGQREPIASLEIYSPAENMWQTGVDLPEPLCAYAAAVYDSELYLFGGWDGTAYVDSIYVYNPDQDAWRRLKTPYPQQLGYASGTTSGDKIYVAGGYDGQREYADVYVYDPAADAWETAPSLNQPRGGLGLAAVGGNLYAIGGGWRTALDSSEKLIIGREGWEEINTPYQQEWRNFGATSVGSDIFLAGGWRGEHLNLLVRFQTLFRVFLPIVP